MSGLLAVELASAGGDQFTNTLLSNDVYKTVGNNLDLVGKLSPIAESKFGVGVDNTQKLDM